MSATVEIIELTTSGRADLPALNLTGADNGGAKRRGPFSGSPYISP